MSKIIYKIKSFIKKLIPKFVFKYYHLCLAFVANIIYGFPSKKMIIIGVTGTNGKTTSCNMLAKILEENGKEVGMMTTINFKIGAEEWVNTTKQGMQGRFKLQKYLKHMLDVNCEYVIVESTSQGIEQFRSFGIDYDVCVFTNITPEHIEAHGGFEKYKKAKLKLFKQLESRKEKIINGKKIEKIIVANFDDKNVLDFINFNVDKIFGFGIRDQVADASEYNNVKNFINDPRYSFLIAKNINLNLGNTSFDIEIKKPNQELIYDYNYSLNISGLFNVYNAISASSVAFSLGFDLESIKNALKKIEQVNGRMQFIKGDNNIYGVVDYAHDPNSIAEVYNNLLKIKNSEKKLIAVLGSCGGGRDVLTRFDKGNAAGALCDYVIVTNEDPFNDDPEKIINDVFSGVINIEENKNSDRVVNKIIRNINNKKEENINAFKILDRRDAFNKAVEIANPGDIIICTGKGAEKGIATKNGEILYWDELEELTNAINSKKNT